MPRHHLLVRDGAAEDVQGGTDGVITSYSIHYTKLYDAPASFQIRFLDELYKAKPKEIADNPFDIEEA